MLHVCAGWFDHWGEQHHTFTAEDTAQRVRTILQQYKASINFYMFTGGTNFAFYNGANNFSSRYQPTITSYDYNAPISECGDTTEKYVAIRDLLLELKLAPAELAAIPANSAKAAYGSVALTEVMQFEDVVAVASKLYGGARVRDTPTFMELLDHNGGYGQNYGYILYRAKDVASYDQLKLNGLLYDAKLVYCNGELVKNVRANQNKVACDLTLTQNNVVDILVENLGRVNFRRAGDYTRMFETQLKGFHGWVGGLSRAAPDKETSVSKQWLHVPMEFDSEFYGALVSSKLWTAAAKLPPQNTQPVVLRGYLDLDADPKDTFLDMQNWFRGVVYINGYNIGRYWSRGPQRTLYVPWPLLRKGRNEIMVFSLNSAQSNVEFTDQPML